MTLNFLQRLSGIATNARRYADEARAYRADIDRAVSDLFQTSGKTGQELRENDWLMGIKQRSAIPGGVCEFDLPSYHYWLHHSPQTRRQDLETWLAPFLAMEDGVGIILRILRESGPCYENKWCDSHPDNYISLRARIA